MFRTKATESGEICDRRTYSRFNICQKLDNRDTAADSNNCRSSRHYSNKRSSQDPRDRSCHRPTTFVCCRLCCISFPSHLPMLHRR